MSERFRNNLFAVLFVIAVLLTMFLTAGCSVTSLTRGDQGELTVTHRTLFIRTEAPSLTVERDSVNEYTANFNAKSRGGDLEAMVQILQMFMAAQTAGAVQPAGE